MAGRAHAPKRARVREKETLSEGLTKVALITSPTSNEPGSLANDVELAKAAVLYSDEVEMVGLAVSLLERLRQLTSMDYGMLRWYLDLDDEALAHVLGQHQLSRLPPGWRHDFGKAFDYERYRLKDPLRWRRLKDILEGAAHLEAGAEPLIRRVLDQSGASELAVAIDSGVIRVAELGMTMSHLYRPSARMHTETVESVNAWVEQLSRRMSDRRYRMIFDADSASALSELVAMGRVQPPDERGSRLAKQGALGSGLIARLPAFPFARMDELLDLRRDLRQPIIKYQAAVIKYAEGLAGDVTNPDLQFDIQQMYESTVRPAVTGIQDELRHHGLVRELSRHVDSKDVITFLSSCGSVSTYLGVASSVSALTMGALGAAAGALPVVATTAVKMLRERRAVADKNRSHEFYLLYKAGELGRGGA